MKKAGTSLSFILVALAFSCNSPREGNQEPLTTEVYSSPENSAINTAAEEKSADQQEPEKTRSFSYAAKQAVEAEEFSKNLKAAIQSGKIVPSNSYAPAAAEPETEANLTLAEIYRHFEKTPQTFSILPGRDTTLICKEGTTLKIRANSFVSEKTGQAVAGPVQIAVKEYYALSDILLANLSTKSGNENLETGGMLHVTASAANEPCQIKPGHSLEIGFPFENRKEGMQLFAGNWHNNTIDWQLSEAPKKEQYQQDTIWVPLQNLIKPDEMPSYRGGEKALKKHLARYALYPLSALKAKTEGTVKLSMVVAKNGKIEYVRVTQSLSPALDKAAVFAAYKMPVWRAARADKKAVEAIQTLDIPFSLPENAQSKEARIKARRFERVIKKTTVHYGNFREQTYYSTNNEKYREDFEKKVNDANLQTASLSEINQYLFSASNLGWINCDRFYKTDGPKIDFVVNHNGKAEANVKLVFHRFRSILPGYYRSGQYAVSEVPTGEKVTIVAFKTEGDKILLAIKEATTTRRGETDLIFEPVTMARLQSEMEKLNNLK